MNKYLEILIKIKKNTPMYTSQLEKIESYIKGEITPEELIKGTDISASKIIYLTINKILNYKEKETRYYLSLPISNLGTRPNDSIIVGNIEKFGLFNNIIKLKGPKNIIPWHNAYGDQNFIEITGDFSKLPEGAVLSPIDKYKILMKHPQLNDFYKSICDTVINIYDPSKQYQKKTELKNRELLGKIPEQLSDKNNSGQLPEEVINSIEFVIPIEYLSMEQIMTGDFGTFQELVNESNNSLIPNVTNFKKYTRTNRGYSSISKIS